jgi:uncharacterized damage-inducible protein DinB
MTFLISYAAAINAIVEVMRLHHLFQGAHAHLTAPAALAGLSADAADRRPGGAPHSIAEIVAHMTFWQTWFLNRCDSQPEPMVAQASLGWPKVTSGEWAAVRVAFENGFARGLALAKDSACLDAPLTPPIDVPPLADYTVRDALTHVALHNAHHLGQVITLRQQLQSWPPPAGSWTW